MKILVVTKNWLGDILFQIPVIEALHAEFPESEIICMSPSRCREILEAHPAVSRVVVFDEKKEHRSWFRRLAFIRTLKREQFDRVYLLHRSGTRAFLTWAAGIPNRIGFGAGRSGWLTQAVPEPAGRIHHTNYFLSLLKQTGIPSAEKVPYHFYFSQQDQALADSRLRALNGKPFVCFHLGANWEPKRWPVKCFAALADQINRESGWAVAITGGAGDRVLGDEFKKQIQSTQVYDWIGQTTLGELGAIFKRSAFVVSSDSGPMHIASGVGAPVLAVFGPTHPELTGPRGTGKIKVIHYVPEGCACPWYGKDLPAGGWMEKISPDQVFQTLIQEGWLKPSPARTS